MHADQDYWPEQIAGWKPRYPLARVPLGLWAAQAPAYDELQRWYRDDTSPIAVLTGPPGVGKTTLAHFFVREYRFPAGFVSASDLQNVRGRPGDESGLLVLDDADLLGSSLPIAITDLETRFPKVPLLIISRQLPISDVPGAVYVKIDQSDTEAALGLIERYLGRRPDSGELQLIMEATRGIPHAIMGVAAAMHKYALSADEAAASTKPFKHSGILDAAGNPIHPESDAGAKVIFSVKEISDELLAQLSENPDLMHRLPPRKFEELVAEIFLRRGYDVKLTKATRDGGKDLYVARKDEIGTTLCLVECKRYRPDRPVGVGVVRNLYGVVNQENASTGMVVTTSTFSRDAEEFQRSVKYRLSLKDYIGVQHWLRDL
jgi:restriction system protein